MSRSARTFTTDPFELEGRLLLAARPHLTSYAVTPTGPPTVQFVSAVPSAFYPIQVVTQQAGEATVTLSRSEFTGEQVLRGKGGAYQGSEPVSSPDTAGSLRVEVTSDLSPNVGTVDQTVTFADGQSQATLTVPIVAGAPNPGEVDVNLRMNPIDPATIGTPALDLKILASDTTDPPKVVSELGTNQGLVLSFNKPMDPVSASDVNNYTVNYVTVAYSDDLASYFGGKSKAEIVGKSVRFQSAQYDPATQSVTLIAKQPSPSLGGLFSTLTPVQKASTSVRRGHKSNVPGSLTDLQGNLINASTTPGKVEYRDVYNPPFGL